MKNFQGIYQKIIQWAGHRHAIYYLATMSFIEASVFPIPPDVMLVPMILAKPRAAWFYALVTTVASVLGGLFGYLIGAFAFDLIHPFIVSFGYEPMYQQIGGWFDEWGFWIIFLAGFTPIPYKLFTIAAGVTQLNLLPFIFGSIIGRGARFFLVAFLVWWGGERMETLLKKYSDRITWVLLGMGVFIGAWYWYHG